MKIHYVTSNKGKFEEASGQLDLAELESKGIYLVHTPLDLEEIQGNALDIARHKSKVCFAKLQEPCIIDDVSLFCPALGGLPGPYIRSFLEALGDEGVAALLSHYSDRSCKVVCHIAYAKDENEPLIFEGRVQGLIVPPRGQRKPSLFNWNAIFQPDGSTSTFAEMSLQETRHYSARVKALTHFRNYLLS